MDRQPEVSVLMTAYNREKYIGFAIESVLKSTFGNFELIIVDDLSKDKTVEIANHYASVDSRVKVFQNENNLGDYLNRNRAAELASGKYLKYVDADDFIYPWGIEILVNLMNNYPDAKWGLCSIPPNIERPFPLLLSPADAYEYHYSGGGIFSKAPLSAIISREVFVKVGGFKPLRMVGDFEMWHRLAQKWPVLLMPEGIVWYRKHAEQEMNDYQKFQDQYKRISIDYLSSDNCPLEMELRLSFQKKLNQNLFVRSIGRIKRLKKRIFN